MKVVITTDIEEQDLERFEHWLNQNIDVDSLDVYPTEESKFYALELLDTSTVSDRIEIALYKYKIEQSTHERLKDVIKELSGIQYDNGRRSMTEIGKELEEVVKHENK